MRGDRRLAAVPTVAVAEKVGPGGILAVEVTMPVVAGVQVVPGEVTTAARGPVSTMAL